MSSQYLLAVVMSLALRITAFGAKGLQRYSTTSIDIQEVRLVHSTDSLSAQRQTFCLNLAFFLICFSCRNVALKGHLYFLHDASLMTEVSSLKAGVFCCFLNSQELALGEPLSAWCCAEVMKHTSNPGVPVFR